MHKLPWEQKADKIKRLTGVDFHYNSKKKQVTFFSPKGEILFSREDFDSKTIDALIKEILTLPHH